MTTYTTTTAIMSADRQTRERVTFYVPDAGGYVLFQTPAMRQRQQLCEDMATMGNTMTSAGPRLQDDIRRATRRAWRKEHAYRQRDGRR